LKQWRSYICYDCSVPKTVKKYFSQFTRVKNRSNHEKNGQKSVNSLKNGQKSVNSLKNSQKSVNSLKNSQKSVNSLKNGQKSVNSLKTVKNQSIH